MEDVSIILTSVNGFVYRNFTEDAASNSSPTVTSSTDKKQTNYRV